MEARRLLEAWLRLLGQVLVDPGEELELGDLDEEWELKAGLEQQLEQVLVLVPELVSARAWKLGWVQQVMIEA